MPHFKKSFPSRYLQVGDLDEGPIVATIKRVSTENVGGGEGELKLVVHFEGTVKPMVANLTRAEAIAAIAGSEDTDDWVNVRLQLVTGETRYQGKKVACIVVQAPPSRKPTSRGTTPAAASVGRGEAFEEQDPDDASF